MKESELQYALTHLHKAELVLFLKDHPEYFSEAVQLAISTKQPYAWRSAWLLWSCLAPNDVRMQEYLPQIIDVIAEKPDNHQRELLKILLKMELNKKQQSYLFEFCIELWKQVDRVPSIRFTAFKFIAKILHEHPELSKEVEHLLDDKYLNNLSPTARRSIMRLVGNL